MHLCLASDNTPKQLSKCVFSLKNTLRIFFNEKIIVSLFNPSLWIYNTLALMLNLSEKKQG